MQNQVKISNIKELRPPSGRPWHVVCAGLKHASAALYLAEFCLEAKQPILVVASDLRTAEAFRNDLRFFGAGTHGALMEFPP